MIFKVMRYLKAHGFQKTFEHARNRMATIYYERKFGVSTAQPVSLSALSLNNKLYRQYRATGYLGLVKCFDILQVCESDVFLDYGAGMGRVCIVAATYPFKKVIGVEISKELCEFVNKNIEKARKKLKCKNIQIIEADAAKYRFPHEVTVCFFFNPFRGEILKQVFKNIKESLEEVPRQLTIIYCHAPDEWQAEAECHWISKLVEFSVNGQPFYIYTSNF